MKLSRRQFIGSAGTAAVGFLGLKRLVSNETAFAATDDFFGPLIPDPKGIFDLPAGFSYDVVSSMGEKMDDGFLVPGSHDGMAAFRGGPGGRTILIRNHELTAEAVGRGPFGSNNELLRNVPQG
ncbi:MAG: DUF839 domain-containing protein, partial [Acidobacteria bacterium]|nr:DUF839 domain-containing protein [Acidobacteriota bacterium]